MGEWKVKGTRHVYSEGEYAGENVYRWRERGKLMVYERGLSCREGSIEERVEKAKGTRHFFFRQRRRYAWRMFSDWGDGEGGRER